MTTIILILVLGLVALVAYVARGIDDAIRADDAARADEQPTTDDDWGWRNRWH